jgi:hypothetical protein
MVGIPPRRYQSAPERGWQEPVVVLSALVPRVHPPVFAAMSHEKVVAAPVVFGVSLRSHAIAP